MLRVEYPFYGTAIGCRPYFRGGENGGIDLKALVTFDTNQTEPVKRSNISMGKLKMEDVLKLMKILVTAIFFVTGTVAIAQNAPSKNVVYAEEACKTGCFVAQAGIKFYQGAVPQSYRVCPMDAYAAKVIVDGISVPIPGISFGVRHCVDVNGKELVALDNNVAVGRLPN